MKAFLLIVFAIANAAPLFEGEDWEAGDIVLSPKGQTLFYYLFRARYTNRKKTLVIWLNGGPGSTSTLGLFLENGPYLFDKNFKLNKNPYSWNNEVDVVYVDQPTGAGFSIVKDKADLCRNEKCIGMNFYVFLCKFYDMHPEYKKKPLFISGESYAGHYIPYITTYLLQANNPDFVIAGISIGNGYINPYVQSPSYPIYLRQHNLCSLPDTIRADYAVLTCNIGSALNTTIFPESCVLLDYFLSKACNIINYYDIRANETYAKRKLAISTLMKDPNTQKILGTEGRNFSTLNKDVNAALLFDHIDVANELNFVVEKGIRTFLYYGDQDFLCDWIGGELLANSIQWKNKEKFVSEKYTDWKVNNKITGKYKKVENLMLMIVKDAGHMAPMDLPAETYSMIMDFYNNKF